ncbi:hypothetical protein MLD63_17215 [Paracoccus sp. TK19116]|uniref:Alpha/beta hydrolase n=1 Tax=Paracoccus albicereus TaxID=2922394 RepID=A0ABT1MUY7_9RHOB|nr:hypothetical protein [Paracoccus albicereus]MCQ0972162.1 hypothetical protein [Paracoccus albicereus]
MSGQCLAGSEDYLITLHRAPCDDGLRRDSPLVVTFGGQPSNCKPHGFRTSWSLQQGWDTIYVAQRHGSQYQGLSLEAFADAVLPATEGRDVVCYGSSLGGYAAIYYAGAIGARMLAASPMLPAWPPLGRVVHQVPILHGDIAEGPLSPHNPIIIFDPLVKSDKKLIEEMVLPAYPDARLVPLEFAGHTVLQVLRASGQLKAFVKTAIVDDDVHPIQRDTENDSIWHFQKGRLLRDSEPEMARSHFERSLEIRMSSHVGGNLLALLLRMGERDSAPRLLDRFRDNPDVAMPAHSRRNAERLGLSP